MKWFITFSKLLYIVIYKDLSIFSDEDWFRAKLLRTGGEGFIPSNFIAKPGENDSYP